MIKSEKMRQATNKTNNGTMRTPVTFYKVGADTSLDGRGGTLIPCFKTYADVYSPSNKDLTIMGEQNVKNGVTIKIRDPLSTYQPDNDHIVVIDDVRQTGKQWSILDIQPDFYDRSLLKIILGGVNL
ncbi:phage head-tail adapter protein [Lactococcus nasutitermitis]|uniref:Phage head-tail adapter protein n=1 Tax=Lactococcus nasutitermitis TaxID=1652957 RepID=A0ABV9JH33_9LACT|nr:phage head-tail adapter protein [Lactococcus nasutitermitis]